MTGIAEVAELLGLTEGQVAENLDFIKDILKSSTCVEEAAEIVKDDLEVQSWDAPKEQEEVKVTEPKAKKPCKCCGFSKKPSRVNAEGICKTCYAALATLEEGQPLQVVGRLSNGKGKRRGGFSTVSVTVGGVRVRVERSTASRLATSEEV